MRPFTTARITILCLLCLSVPDIDAQNFKLRSPNGKLSANLCQTEAGHLTYSLATDRQTVIVASRLGYRLADGTEFPAEGWTIESRQSHKHRSEWRPVWGKRAVVADRYNELVLHLAGTGALVNALTVEVRLYDDGLAFRYVMPRGTDVKAERELTEFNYATNPIAWFYNGENANYGPVLLSEVNETRQSNVTMMLATDLYVNQHEACLIQGDPLRLASRRGEHSLHVASSPGVFGRLTDGYTSAWRTVMVGDRPGALVDSHMTELLNPEPEMDFSWVRPGVAVWDWRIDGAVWEGFTYSMSYPSWIRMVDFAAEQGFAHLVLDANWYGPEFSKDSDPLTGDKANDVRRLIAYARKRGVGIWLYLNDVGGRRFPIEQTLKQYGEWGAAGVKYGFMNGTPEEKNLWTQKVTRLCAENHLLVDFHDGPVHPYGQMRTWPNAVTREFCHAQLDAHRVFSPSTFCTSVFVNMVAGPLDMNNGMFDLRQGHTTRVDESQPVPSTVVSEAARTLITFSGATVIPDIPEYYRLYPDLLRFLSAQKMPWVESRTLDGEIGKYIVMMRQTDDAILVAAATNEEARTVELPLDFLGKGTYSVMLVEDGPGAHYLHNRETTRTSRHTVKRSDSLTLHMAPGGGNCLIFEKR